MHNLTPISAIVLTKNEEKNIKKCLMSLEWCSEIIVVDDYSSDATLGIIKSFKSKKVRVLTRKLNNNFALQRNFGLSKAKNDWVLFLDADETVSAELEEEIANLKLQTTGISGYYIKRRDFFMGKELKHGETANVKLLRLGRKGTGKWVRSIHEDWRVKGKTDELGTPILHYPHETIGEFLTDLNNYSTQHAKENKRERKNFNFLFVIFHPLGKFFVNYILKLGFLDGTHGFVSALFMSFHSFLSWSKYR